MFRINGYPVQIQRYPDGAPRLHIAADGDGAPRQETFAGAGGALIQWFYEKDEEMLLFFITKHLRTLCAVDRLTLHMPYIPHARMDRVKDKTEVFTLKYFCAFINSLHFDRVIVRDAHSFVSLALLDNVEAEPIEEAIKTLIHDLLDPARDIVFYPDEGSCKRYTADIPFPCAFGVKKRDWGTGAILGLDLHGDLPPAPFNALIIDDISSYGGTFLHAARKLKELGAEKLYLYVTHCENTILEGELIHSGLLERIYTTRSIYTGEHPLIEVIEGIGEIKGSQDGNGIGGDGNG